MRCKPGAARVTWRTLVLLFWMVNCATWGQFYAWPNSQPQVATPPALEGTSCDPWVFLFAAATPPSRCEVILTVTHLIHSTRHVGQAVLHLFNKQATLLIVSL